MIKEVPITDEMLLAARAEVVEMGPVRGSLMNNSSNMFGFLGEQVALVSLPKATLCHTYDYDIKIPLKSDVVTVDVKTKQTTVAPKDFYTVMVMDRQKEQKCDYYAFCRVKFDMSVGWFFGVISKKDFFDNAEFLKAGDKDGTFTVKADCWSMAISEVEKYSAIS